MKKTKKRLCQSCKQRELYYRGGIPISKYCSICKKLKEQEKKEKKKLTKTYQKREYKILHNKAWKLFSTYIRSKELRPSGMGECYTCRLPFRWQDLHAGHFHHGKLDFDERNVHPQCSGCNTYRHGNLALYGTRLANQIGVDGMEKLRLDSNTIKYSKDDLETIIHDLEEKLKLLNPSL